MQHPAPLINLNNYEAKDEREGADNLMYVLSKTYKTP